MNLQESSKGIKGNRFAVTGGLGFLGSALCLDLMNRGAEEVRSLDTCPSSTSLSDLQKHGVHCIRGDVSQKQDVEKALRGVNCVFHLASYGHSSKEMLQGDRLEEVNLNGTCNILDVCHEFGVERLVYLSTYQTVFGGEEIINGDESLPYYSIDEQVDSYGRSKSIAEQLILKSNGRSSEFLWKLFSPFLNHPWIPGPLLLPAEVYKIGVTHYFSHEKAREELGYVPIVSPHEGLARTISYWRQRKEREIVRPNILFWVFCIGGMLGLFYTAFLSPLAPLRWLNSLSLFIFRSTDNLRLVFYVAAMLHVSEGICIWLLARRVDPSNARAWFVQTILLGYPSARLLLKRIH